MSNKVRVLVLLVGQKGAALRIENTLEAQQELVGGPIEVLHVGNCLSLIFNEEGKYEELTPNVVIPGDIVCGDCFIARNDGKGQLIDITDDDIKRFALIPRIL